MIDKGALVDYILSNLNVEGKTENVSISELEKSICECVDIYEAGDINFTELCSSLYKVRLYDEYGNSTDDYLSDIINISPVEIGKYVK